MSNLFLLNSKQARGALYRHHHDRYLLIDRQMEIVVTSGIDYLFDNDKECTLIFRPLPLALNP